VRELTPLLPELGERIGAGVPERGEPDSDRYRLFEAIDGWLAALARYRPVLLVLDDLHWADRPSLLLLEHLMRRADASRLLILATYRPPELHPGSQVLGALANFRRRADVERMTVGGLSADEVLDLFERVGGHPLGERAARLAERLQRKTCGNPFFLWEMTRHLVELGIASEHDGYWDATVDADAVDVPESVREVVQARIARLSDGCQRFLGVASLKGDEFRARIAAEASDTSQESLVDILDEAMHAGILNEVSAATNRYTFAHAVVRDTVHDSLSHGRRIHIHHKIGLALERQCGTSGPHLAQLAYHLCEGASAGNADEAVHYAQLAGQQAMLEVAYEAAGLHYRRAIEVVDLQEPRDEALRCQLLLALGDAHNKAGDAAAGCDRFVEAAEAARALDSAEHLASAAIGFGGVMPAAVEPSRRAQSLLEEALGRLGGADSTARALALGRLAHWLNIGGSRTERVVLCNDAIAMARRLGDPATLAEVLSYRYWALDGPDDVVSQLEAGTEIAKLGEKLGDREIVLQGYKCQLHALFELGHTGAAERIAGSMTRLADELRQPEYLRLAMMWEATTAGLQGRFEVANRLAAETRALLRQSGHPQEQVIYFALTLPWRWLGGCMAEVVPALERAVERQATTLTWPALLAWAYAETGQPERAADALEAIGPEAVRDMDRNFYWWTVVVALANSVAALKQPEWASLLYGLMVPYRDHNSTTGQALFLGAASHHVGVLACTLHRWDEAIDHLEHALERHQEMGARPFVALTKQAYASALRGRNGTGDTDLANQALGDALALAAELELGPVVLRHPFRCD
jgi:tetratricopeptide (TPR) repeat protein